jgi:general stress protein 26
MKNTASEIKNLSENEAIQKFKELVDHESICLFTTRLTEIPLTTRPMAIQKVDNKGNFWFLSAHDSDKNSEIASDPRVQLFISNPSNYEFLSIYGYATYSRDRQKIDELWNDIAKAWFPKERTIPGHSHQVRTRARSILGHKKWKTGFADQDRSFRNCGQNV